MEDHLAEVIDFALEKSKRGMKKFMQSLTHDLRQAVLCARHGAYNDMLSHYQTYGEKAKELPSVTAKFTDSLNENQKCELGNYLQMDIIAIAEAYEALNKFIESFKS